MEDEEYHLPPPPEKNFRQRLSGKLFDLADHLEHIRSRMHMREMDWLQKHLPRPSNVVSYVHDVIFKLADEVDDVCAECECSPGHSEKCSKYCPVRHVMES